MQTWICNIICGMYYTYPNDLSIIQNSVEDAGPQSLVFSSSFQTLLTIFHLIHIYALKMPLKLPSHFTEELEIIEDSS